MEKIKYLTQLKASKSSNMSTLKKFYLNFRPKLLLLLKNTSLLITKLDCPIISQLLLIKPELDISSISLSKNYTFDYKSTFIKKFSTLSSEITAENGQETLEEREMNNFYEWLSGFTDAEGSFYIAISNSCAFRFQINLHKDDVDLLYYIHRTLGFGEVRSYNNYSSFTVTRLKDIALLLKIFNDYPLQGSKWLNYKDFTKAFELYVNSDKGSNIIKEILEIKNGMNKSRTDFKIPKDKEINITPCWLLGFIEGEGCFSINKGNNYRLDFSLPQAHSNLELMKKIKVYLENLPNTNNDYEDIIGISMVKSNNTNHESTIRIETTRIPYITNIFIPFLESLNWHSKKQFDFQDWKNILMLKEQGHHLSEQGEKLINLILSQMNKNRLSTNSSQPIVDRNRLLEEVNKLLNGPSNIELRNGRKWIISLKKYYNSSRKELSVVIVDENGKNLHTFDSLADCGKFLNVHPSTVSKRIIKSIPFLLENKQVFIKKVS